MEPALCSARETGQEHLSHIKSKIRTRLQLATEVCCMQVAPWWALHSVGGRARAGPDLVWSDWAAHRKESLLRGLHIGALLGDLVGLLHVLIEDLQSDSDQGWVGHPGAIMAILHLPQLVSLDLDAFLELSISG